MSEVGLKLRVTSLGIGYDKETVLNALSFTLPAGGSLAVIGESGCGKSTLLTTLAQLHPALQGTIHWEDETGRAVSLSERRVSFVWQRLGLFPWKRVQDNLRLPLQLHPDICPESERESRVAALIEQLGLTGLERRFPSALSGGQNQRLALGRSLISRPEVLFMDEPFSALDALLRERLQDHLRALRQSHPGTMIFVTHDIREAVFLGSHILMLFPKATGRAPIFLENDAFIPEWGSSDRESTLFEATVRHIHKTLMQRDVYDAINALNTKEGL